MDAQKSVDWYEMSPLHPPSLRVTVVRNFFVGDAFIVEGWLSTGNIYVMKVGDNGLQSAPFARTKAHDAAYLTRMVWACVQRLKENEATCVPR